MLRPLALTLCLAAGAALAQAADTPGDPATGTARFTLTSAAFSPGGMLEHEQVFNGFGCDGKNVSPALAWKNGIEPHAGHGLTYDNVVPIAAIPQLAELNIGHYLIGEAIFTGLEHAIQRMRGLMDEARG